MRREFSRWGRFGAVVGEVLSMNGHLDRLRLSAAPFMKLGELMRKKRISATQAADEIAAMEGKTPEEMDAEFNQRMIELGAPDWVRMEPEIDEQHEIEIGEIDMQMIAENWENWPRPSLKLQHPREPRKCVHRWLGRQ